MKQLSALGARRHFFRSPRRMRGLRGEMDDGDLLAQGYGYYNGTKSYSFCVIILITITSETTKECWGITKL